MRTAEGWLFRRKSDEFTAKKCGQPKAGFCGSKSDEIVKRFPDNFKKYVEVFGGAAWVLFSQERIAEKEFYNDKNGELVNLFKDGIFSPLAKTVPTFHIRVFPAFALQIAMSKHS